MSAQIGKIRVGRRKYVGKTFTEPSYDGFTPVIVMIKDDVAKKEYGALSPYNIKTPDGVIVENYWQFLKVYPSVPKIDCTYSTNDPTVVFSYDGGQHIDKNGNVTPEWEVWRKKGFVCNQPVRFPVGPNPKARANCKFALCIKDDGTIDTTNRLDYVESRKKTYGKVYCENVKLHPLFNTLKERLNNGENLLIIEVDGPHQESLEYYKEKYNVDDDFIENYTIEVDSTNMKILLNDTKHPFGHGYCLAMELLGIRKKVCKA